MKKIYIISIVLVLCILLISTFNLSDNMDRNNDVVGMLNETDFTTIDFENLIEKVIQSPLKKSTDNILFEKFTLGLTKELEIRTLNCTFTSNNFFSSKRYHVMYKNDTSYFNIHSSRGNNKRENPALQGSTMFEVLETLRDNFVTPEGEHDYYTIELLTPYSSNLTVTEESSKLVFEIGGEDSTKNQGIIIFVYGEPVGKNDNPLYYFFK